MLVTVTMSEQTVNDGFFTWAPACGPAALSLFVTWEMAGARTRRCHLDGTRCSTQRFLNGDTGLVHRLPGDLSLNHWRTSGKPEVRLHPSSNLPPNRAAKAVPLPGDIQDDKFCVELMRNSQSALKDLDILVNVAGHQQACESILDLTTKQFDETLKTNVYAMFWLGCARGI